MATESPNLDSYLDPDRYDAEPERPVTRDHSRKLLTCDACGNDRHSNLTRYNGQSLCASCLLAKPDVQLSIERDRQQDIHEEGDDNE